MIYAPYTMDNASLLKPACENVEKKAPRELIHFLSRCSLPGKTGKSLSLEEYANTLFARVPKDALREMSGEVVAELIIRSLRSLKVFIEEKEELLVETDSTDHFTTIHIALHDKSFIVSSVAEALGEKGLNVELFLHPTIIIDYQAIALSCITFSSERDYDLKVVKQHIQDILWSLDSVVKDFDSITASTSEVMMRMAQGTIRSESGEVNAREVSELLNLFLEGSFLFLASNWFSGNPTSVRREISLGSGLWRNTENLPFRIAEEVSEDLLAITQSGFDFSIRKLRAKSPVHRRVSLLHILIKTGQEQRPYFSLIGYLTSKALAREAEDVPILRVRLGAILKREGVLPSSYDFKYISDVVDHIPTDEALTLTEPQLQAIVQLAIGVFDQEAIRTHIYRDTAQRRVSAVIVLPSEKESIENRVKIRHLVEAAACAEPGTSEVQIDASKRKQHRLYVTVPLPFDKPLDLDFQKLSQDISLVTRSWREELVDTLGDDDLASLAKGAFDDDYMTTVSASGAARDVELLSQLSGERRSILDLCPGELKDTWCLTFLTQLEPPTISSLGPLLLNFGFITLGARLYRISLAAKDATHILKVDVKCLHGSSLSLEVFSDIIAPGILAALRNEIANDSLNSLSLKLSINHREVSVLRAYCQLLWQISRFAARNTVIDVMAHYSEMTGHIWRAFSIKFDPQKPLGVGDRLLEFASIEESFMSLLRKVKDNTADKVLRSIWSLCKSTVRTNFYQKRESLVFKLRTGHVEFAPEPRPLFELYVTSPTVEGTHLRSSQVARGGIRWSDRPEDFRTEVLALMKTQTVKNVIIVPSGAKGGFIAKNLDPSDPAKNPEIVRNAYKDYIRALLTVADNKIGGKIIRPSDCIVYDDEDPYFVVAADKGTAAFSDIANSIALDEFQFWLGDAFASGGSKGYDHKKYGITAKGAWECVKRHFRDLRIDFENKPFSVVGIGDMSGDVFGNGLLLSPCMRLVAAFNHKHIFLDPNPDSEISFQERQRLFHLPRSEWTDYSRALISHGGGVFSKFEKEIPVSKEIRAALDIPDICPAVISGEALIRWILKAPVDLIWNGGIGTYVKASYESHSNVNDSANDGVRVDAVELRAKVIGEGGNVGLTQRARVEFSAKNGRVNTDAIDNSAGVDLSDHEVNLKLLLNPLMDSGEISAGERDSLLYEMADDVCNAVLAHNSDQALLLTTSQIWSMTSIDSYQTLLRNMQRYGFLNRAADGLPDDEELSERQNQGLGLYRPELAVCSAAVKTWIKKDLIQSKLLNDPALQKYLVNYFPTAIRHRLQNALLSHALKREIIATEIVNEILPGVGITFVHATHSLFGVAPHVVVKNILAADSILGISQAKKEFMRFDTPEKNLAFLQLWLDCATTLVKSTTWLIGCHGDSLSLTETSDLYKGNFQVLLENIEEIFVGQEKSRFARRISNYQELGLDTEAASRFATFRRILPILEVLWTQNLFKIKDVRRVATVFSEVLEELGINIVLKYEGLLDYDNKWEEDLIINSFREIRRSISLITGKLVNNGISDRENVQRALEKMKGFERVKATGAELAELEKQKKTFRIAVLPVVSRELRLMHQEE